MGLVRGHLARYAALVAACLPSVTRSPWKGCDQENRLPRSWCRHSMIARRMQARPGGLCSKGLLKAGRSMADASLPQSCDPVAVG